MLLDLLGTDKGHLHINLGELRLAIGPQVFITEALDDLKIAVKPGDHQELLKQLGGLGQCIEATRIHAAGNEIIPRPFGGAAGEEGGFDLHKAMRGKIVPHDLGCPVPEEQVALHPPPAEIKIPIAEPHVLRHLGLILDGKSGGLGFVEYPQPMHRHLYLAGGEAGICHILWAQLHDSLNCDDVLAPQGVGLCMDCRVYFGVKDHLGNPIPIAQIHKDQPSMISSGLYPAHHGDLCPDILLSQIAARMRAPPITQKIHPYPSPLEVPVEGAVGCHTFPSSMMWPTSHPRSLRLAPINRRWQSQGKRSAQKKAAVRPLANSSNRVKLSLYGGVSI